MFLYTLRSSCIVIFFVSIGPCISGSVWNGTVLDFFSRLNDSLFMVYV